MNKQLVELAEQAGFLNNYNVPEDGFEVFFVDEKHTTKCLAKFAELLIQECADIAKHNVMNISTYADAEFVDEQIKQHFGVKE